MNSTHVENDGSDRPDALKETARITAACIIFWGLLAGPAWLVASARGLIGLSVAAGLCWVPACAVQPFRVLLDLPADIFSLISGGVRLAFVLTGALIAKYKFPEFGVPEFFAWLVLFYLFTLGLETVVLMRKRNQSAPKTD